MSTINSNEHDARSGTEQLTATERRDEPGRTVSQPETDRENKGGDVK